MLRELIAKLKRQVNDKEKELQTSPTPTPDARAVILLKINNRIVDFVIKEVVL